MTFTHAAGSLEKSYTQLQTEVARLHVELQRANSELERSLEGNARMRGYLARMVENLPCGMLVAGADGVQLTGLRTVSATMTNVVDVYINYLQRKVDTGYDRALIRTIRGVGYQIGGTAARSAVAGSPVGVGSSSS